MSHLTERTILELRDGVPVDADASAHLDECAVCRTALEEAEARSVDIASALTDLDEGFDVASAREAVATRLAGRGENRSNRPAGQLVIRGASRSRNPCRNS